MSAKLSFRDVYNNELALEKINFGSVNGGLVVGSGAPADASLSVGTLYIDSNSGSLYRKTDPGAATYVQLTSLTDNAGFSNQIRTITGTVSVTSGDAVFGDLVGIFGLGAWTSSTNMNQTRSALGGTGSSEAAIAIGGNYSSAATTGSTTTELFNGITWTNSVNINTSRAGTTALGSQNGALVAGGNLDAVTLVLSSELFNGSAWAASANINFSRSHPASGGSVVAGWITGSYGPGPTMSTTEIFNGSAWSSSANLNISSGQGGGCGSMNAGLVSGGTTVAGAAMSKVEMFNGSAWCISAPLSVTNRGLSCVGTQASALVAGGLNGGGAGVALSSSLVFNGSAWAASGSLNLSRYTHAAAGGQASGLVFGGADFRQSEIHNQSIYRKLYPRYINTAKNIGILVNSSQIVTQGTVSGTTQLYPANKWLIVNRTAVCSITNAASFVSSLTLSSVQGTAPTMTYNLSAATNMLSLMPGMIINVVANGADPVDAANAGAFVISRIPSTSSIEVENASGLADNPCTGYIEVISTMLAVDNISPQDIVIGRTNNFGSLIIYKPLQVGDIAKRFK
jgi:hypothetical protein